EAPEFFQLGKVQDVLVRLARGGSGSGRLGGRRGGAGGGGSLGAGGPVSPAATGHRDVAQLPLDVVVLFHGPDQAELRSDERHHDVAGAKGDLVDGGKVRGVGHGQGKLAVVQGDRHHPVLPDDLFGDKPDDVWGDVRELLRGSVRAPQFLAQELG